MTKFETEDERRRRIRALGLDPNSVLGDGERMRIGMMFGDSATPGSTYLKDAPMTVSINDAMQQIPSEFRSKMRYEINRMADRDPFIIRQGIESAQGLIQRMHMTRDGYGGAAIGMVTDADKTNLTSCADYLQGHMKVASQRLAEMGR